MTIALRVAATSMVLLLSPPAALGQRAISLDENVTWMPSAQIAEIPAELKAIIARPVEADDNQMASALRRVAYRVSANELETTMLSVDRYLGVDGINDFGNQRVVYDSAQESVEIARALVVDSAGSMHVVDPATVQIIPAETQDIFSDTQIIVLPMEGLDVGSVTVLSAKITTRTGNGIAPVMRSLFEQSLTPQERLEIRVEWDQPDLEPAWSSDYEGLACERPDDRSLTCVATEVPAYPQDPDVVYNDVVPQFVLAERRTWEEVQHWFGELFRSALSADETIKATSERLTADAHSELGKLKAIHDFVARDVRYVGLEHGDNAYVPHETSVTLQRRYGDCKDKTALLTDLLAHAGIEMAPVLVAARRRNPNRLVLPSGGYFNHLLACGELSDGREYCLDPTAPYSGVDALSGPIQGAVALRVSGAPAPSKLPADTYRWSLSEELVLRVMPDGGLAESGRLLYSTAYGSWVRSMISRMSSDELQQWAVADYQHTISDLVEPVFTFAGIDSIDDGVTVSWEADFGAIIARDEDLSYSDDPGWLDQLIGFFGSRNETHDYSFAGLSYKGTTRIHVSKPWRADLGGPEINIRSEFGEFTRSYEVNERLITVHTSVELPAKEIPQKQLERFNRFLEILKAENTIRVGATLTR